ncbi:MAG: alpha/beta hydrolase [Coriobacteriia bacterium]
MRRLVKPIVISVVALLLLASAGFYAWTRIAAYPAFPEAAERAGQAETDRGWYVFEPAGEPSAGFVFYPGGLVDPAAYALLMQRLSDSGVLVVIVPMPLDLAVLGIGRADDVIATYADIDTWVIGGHSLGGAMAAEYVKGDPGKVDGVVFLASYPAESTDLSGLPVSVLSLYGTEDGVSGDVFEASLQRLPDDTSLVTIEGGNHAQFGHYGPQDGDGVATMSRDEQQQMTADAILRLIDTLE